MELKYGVEDGQWQHLFNKTHLYVKDGIKIYTSMQAQQII